MPFRIVKEEIFGNIPRVWADRVISRVVLELERYCTIKICRPPRAVELYEEKDICPFHRGHFREKLETDRLILEENCSILWKIEYYVRVYDPMFYILGERTKFPTKLVSVKISPRGEAGQSVSVECWLKKGVDLSCWKITVQNQTGDLSLRQRSLVAVAERILARADWLEDGGTEPETVGREVRRLGLYTDPGVLAHIKRLELPGVLKRQLEIQLCAVRPECSYYIRPDPQHRSRPNPFRAAGQSETSESSEEDEPDFVFLAERLGEVLSL